MVYTDTNDFDPAFQDWELSDEEHEIHDADMDRSFTVICEAWESEEEFTVDEMCEHLEALIKVVERKSTFIDFKNETNIYNKSYLH